MDKFCGKCGAEIDAEIGYCPCCADTHTHICVEEKKKTGAIILSVVLFAVLFVFVSLITVKSSTASSNAVYSVIDDIEYADVCNNITVYNENGRPAVFGKYLNRYFNEKWGIKIDEETLSEIIEESTIKRFISTYAYVYCYDFANDTNLFHISSLDVYYLLRSEKYLIEDEFNIEVSDDVLQEIADWIVDDESVRYISPRTVRVYYPSLSSFVKIALSNITLFLMALLVAILIYVLVRYYRSYAKICVGIVSIITAALFLAAGALLITVFSKNVFMFIAGHFILSKIWFYVLVLTIGIMLLFYKRIANLLIKNR